MKDMDAIYFIEPSEPSVKHIIRDFNIPGSAYYKNAHIFLTHNGDSVLDTLSKYSNVVSSIKTFRIANLDYIPIEQRSFIFGDQNSFIKLYSADSNTLEDSCNLIVQQLFSICTSFNYPIIRYARSHPLSAAITAKLCGLMELKEIEMKNENSVLLLVDRTHDLISPLIHEFSYQSMLADILGLGENGKLVYKKESGLNEGKDIILNEKDKIWTKTRHWHIEAVHQKIASSAKHLHYEQSSSEIKKQELEKKGDLKGLFELAKAVPINQSLASKLSDHLDLVSLCYSYFKENFIEELSTLEQDLSTGLTSNFKKIEYNKVYKALKNIMNNPKISLNNKLRLLMINLNTGPTKENWKKLLANIPQHGINVLRNYREILRTTSRQKQTRPPQADEFNYTLQRYKPALYNILKDLINDKLCQDEFPYFYHNDKDKLCDRIKCEKSKWKRTDSKYKWKSILKRSKSDQSVESTSRRIIIFMIGGLSLNELRACYELSNESVSIYAGSTHLLTPEKFIKDIQRIKPA